MIACDAVRARLGPAAGDDALLLEHIRACDSCLTVAVESNPDLLFRALGGQEEMLPPGGVDGFVDDVMREVRLRSTESTMSVRRVNWTRRIAVAATIALGIAGGAALYRPERSPAPVRLAVSPKAVRTSLTTRPVVETYHSETATIVEVPTEGVGDVKLVMVFDETLPADL